MKLRRDQRGAVYVEFLLVFPPLLLLFLVILQYSLLAASSIGVRHAASSAVRSAVVVLPDDPAAYGDTPVGEIGMSSSCGTSIAARMNKVFSFVGASNTVVPENGKCLGGQRYADIRTAAVWRMMAFSPNVASMLPAGMGDALSNMGSTGFLAGAALYSYGATGVTFPDKPEADTMSFVGDTEVKVRVTYLSHCGIPLARFFMCDSGHSLLIGFDVNAFDRFKHAPGTLQSTRERIKSVRGDLSTLAKGVSSTNLYALLLGSGEFFTTVSAEATLPITFAPYQYAAQGNSTSRGSKKKKKKKKKGKKP